MAIPAAPGDPWTPEGIAGLVGQEFPVVIEGGGQIMVTVLEASPHPQHPMAAALVLVESRGMMPQGLAPGSRHPELN